MSETTNTLYDRVSSLSLDASPLEPRDHEEQRGLQDQASHEETFVNIPTPDPNWNFNSFLVDLADEIDDDELDKLKHLFIGIIGRGTLEKISTARDLFDHLRRQTFLTRDNLLYLQCILRKLNRPGLIRMAVKYARKAGNVIHFHEAAPEEPLNGCTTVKFHVEGKDFRNCTPVYINDLRFKVSTMLFIPPQDVLITGVAPSSSMLITIIIPDLYADLLKEMLVDEESFQPLIDLEIDAVQIGDNIFNIRGVDEIEIVETEQQRKLVNVYHQLQEKSRQLERISEEAFDLSKEKEILKRKMVELEMETVTLRAMFNKTNEQTTSLASQSAFELFKQGIKKVKTFNYDTTVIRQLLQANSMMVAIRMRDESKCVVEQLNLNLNNLASQVLPLRHELEIIRLTESRSLEQLLNDSFLQLLQSIAAPIQQVGQILTDSGNEILKKLSRSLRYKDRQTLEKKYTWKPNDRLTKYKDDDPSLLLACLFYKEIEAKCTVVDINKFIQECLNEVNRKDLLQKFQEMLSKQSKSHKQKTQPPQEPRTEATPPPSQSDIRLSKLEEMLPVILEKVNGIADQIKCAKQYGMPYEPYDKRFSAYQSNPFQTGI